MLASGSMPEPAAAVIAQLKLQEEVLASQNTAPQLECVRGNFHSPMAEWLPRKSQECEFHVLKPPAGVQHTT